MATLNVDDFKAKLKGGGARANLFRVTCNFPAFAGGDPELASFLIKGAQLPGSILQPIMVPFRGRQLQLAGDRTFEPWTITVINDTDMAVRNAFERWSNGINQHVENTGLSDPTDYQTDMAVEQLDKEGNVTKNYTFRGVWPSNISPIEVSYETENTIEEFTVELQVQYWESAGTTS